MSDIAREVTARIAAVLDEEPQRIRPDALLVQDLGADSVRHTQEFLHVTGNRHDRS